MGIARAQLIGGPQITREFLQGWLGQSVEDVCPDGASVQGPGANRSQERCPTGVAKE